MKSAESTSREMSTRNGRKGRQQSARLVLSAACAAAGAARASGATDTLVGVATKNGAIDLTASTNSANVANWSLGRIPTATDEAEIPTGFAANNASSFAPAYNVGIGGTVSIGDLIVNDNAGYDIGNATATTNAYTLTLNGSGGSTQALADGGATGDLLLIGTNVLAGTNITIGNNVSTPANASAGVMKIALGASGNFDVVNAGASATITSNISGSSFALTKTGAGTLILTGTSSYSGGTYVNGGILSIATTNNLGSSGSVVSIGPATLLFTGGVISGRTFMVNSATSAINTSNGGLTLNGPVGNVSTGTLNKFGNSALTLTSSNTYAGGTNVNAGTLYADSTVATNSSTGSGPVTVAARATLAGNGFILNTTGPVTVNGTIGAGPSAGTVGTLTTNAQVWNGGGTFASNYTAASPATGTFGELVMSSLTINVSTGTFAVNLSNISTGVTLTTATAPIVLAYDSDTSSANPFNISAGNPFATLATLQAALVLNVGPGITVTGGTAQLDAMLDSSGTGYDLLLDVGPAATPEPTSLVLLGVTVAPLTLGRQRRCRVGTAA